jgi:chemotaxis response regulator CheB
MTNPITILAVDDHVLLRRGISAIIASQSDMSLVAEASNGREAVDQYRRHRPDITLMDLQMPEMNGLDTMIGVKSGIIQLEVLLAKATCCLKRVDREALSGLVAGSRSGTLRKGYL